MSITVHVEKCQFGDNVLPAVCVAVTATDGNKISVRYADAGDVEYLIKQLQLAVDELRRKQADQS